MKIGDRVTYGDEYLGGDPAEMVGTIVEPTEDELRIARTSGDAYGANHGDVMVEWGDGDRFWEDPADLVPAPEAEL